MHILEYYTHVMIKVVDRPVYRSIYYCITHTHIYIHTPMYMHMHMYTKRGSSFLFFVLPTVSTYIYTILKYIQTYPTLKPFIRVIDKDNLRSIDLYYTLLLVLPPFVAVVLLLLLLLLLL